MELIIYAVLIYLAYLVIRWIIVNIILPVGRIATIVALVAGTAIGAFVAIKSYLKSIKDNINPYDYYEDSSKNKQEFAKRRSYFFGPGFLQLRKTIADAWKGIGSSVEWVFRVRGTIGGTIDIPVIKQVNCFFPPFVDSSANGGFPRKIGNRVQIILPHMPCHHPSGRTRSEAFVSLRTAPADFAVAEILPVSFASSRFPVQMMFLRADVGIKFFVVLKSVFPVGFCFVRMTSVSYYTLDSILRQ